MEWHSLKPQEIVQQLETDLKQGLDDAEAKRRLEKFGANLLVKEREVSFFGIAREELTEPMILLLLAVGVLYSFWGELRDALTILGIILTIVSVEVWSEFRAKRSIAALKRLASPSTVVVRGGRLKEIPTSELVPGDLMLLKVGQRIPADARLVESYGLQVDESSLTGESFPIPKDANVILPKETEIADRKNMVFAGTVVTRGRGKAIVVATGSKTELGRVGKLAQEIKEPKTPLQVAMKQLSGSLVWIALFFSGLVLVLGIIRGQPWEQMVLMSLSLAFATIPEEMPIIITMVLGLGAYALSKKHALVKRLRAAETLGSVTVIVTDKTGTITQNRLTMVSFYFDDKISQIGSSREVPRKLLETALLAGGILTEVEEEKTSLGNPFETAILEVAQNTGINVQEIQSSYTLRDEFSFDNTRKIASYIYEHDNNLYVFSSGAPEAVLERSVKIWKSHGELDLSAEDREKLGEIISEMASRGWRLLGLGYRKISEKERLSAGDVERNLVFVGILGFVDPPRSEVREAIRSCHEAGIRVVMVTGDHPDTAKAIAAEVGINTTRVLSGVDISKMSDEELKEALKTTFVFARTTPEHKLRIVRLLRELGGIVAVIGDGINDAPALKEAHIGIAMGIRGTDIAKETADMILTDDNFATVATAVREGRKMYDNLRKGVRYYLACKVALVSSFLLPLLLGVPPPFAPIQIIVMELFMDLAASATFIAEPGESDVMVRPPRNPKEKFMTRAMQSSIFISALGLFMAVSVSYLFHWYKSYSLVQAQTAAFAAWMLGHIFLAFNLRSEKEPLYQIGFLSNKPMLVWATTVVLALLLSTNVTPLQESLKTTSLPEESWALVVGITIATTFWMEAKKAVQSAITKKRKNREFKPSFKPNPPHFP
ncbi:MAG: cation-transporting P-type ATPase [Fervidicoccaceae archaeon]